MEEPDHVGEKRAEAAGAERAKGMGPWDHGAVGPAWGHGGARPCIRAERAGAAGQRGERGEQGKRACTGALKTELRAWGRGNMGRGTMGPWPCSQGACEAMGQGGYRGRGPSGHGATRPWGHRAMRAMGSGASGRGVERRHGALRAWGHVGG